MVEGVVNNPQFVGVLSSRDCYEVFRSAAMDQIQRCRALVWVTDLEYDKLHFALGGLEMDFITHLVFE